MFKHLLVALFLFTSSTAIADDNIWPLVRETHYGDQTIAEETGKVILEVPSKINDPAIVPITIRIPPSVKGPVKSLSLFIDNNPKPLVAKLYYGPASGSGGERVFSTRVRVDKFSYIRAVLQLADGSLHMTKKFLSAAGGCAAMQAKDPEADNQGVGKMVVKKFEPTLESNSIWKAQVMIKHPNHNGLQLDINTAEFIPEWFVNEVVVSRDGELVFKLFTSFSISTNPNFRFTFQKGEKNDLRVIITDTKGKVYKN